MSLFKQNIEILPVTTEEALLLKATMNRLAQQNKIAGPGTDDVFDEKTSSNIFSSPTDRSLINDSNKSQHMSIGSDAISKFLAKRNDDKRKEEMKSTRRQQKSGGKSA